MNFKELGNANIKVSSICLGTMTVVRSDLRRVCGKWSKHLGGIATNDNSIAVGPGHRFVERPSGRSAQRRPRCHEVLSSSTEFQPWRLGQLRVLCRQRPPDQHECQSCRVRSAGESRRAAVWSGGRQRRIKRIERRGIRGIRGIKVVARLVRRSGWRRAAHTGNFTHQPLDSVTHSNSTT